MTIILYESSIVKFYGYLNLSALNYNKTTASELDVITNLNEVKRINEEE